MMIKTFYTSIFIFFLCAYSWSAQLQINTQTGKKGDSVTFTVFIHNSPDPVNAFGFEITYDPTSMIYQSIQRGALISNGFRFFQASNVGFGRIRIGGIETGDNIIQKQAIGSLALIQFNIIGDTNSFVRLENLKDDLKTWTTQDGQFVLESEETDDTTENEAPDSENETIENNNSYPGSNEETVISSQLERSQDTTTRPKFPNIVTIDDTQPKSTKNATNSQSSNRKHTLHDETSQQSKAKKNQQFDQIQKNATDKLSHKQQPTDQTQSHQQDFHNNVITDSLAKRDWGHIKPVGVSADSHQNSAISQNHVFTFPSFLSATIVISMMIQMGILILLFLIYRQLIKTKGGDMN
jgi:flagellar hook-basal body complex protein FliE